MAVDTKKVTGRRSLHFESLDEILVEAQRLAAGPHRQLGNWTLGQISMHLARAGEASIDGTPDRPGWLFIKSPDGKMTRPRWFLRILCLPFAPLCKWYFRRWGPPPGIRPPAFFWKQVAALQPNEALTTQHGRTAGYTWQEIETVSMANRVTTEDGLIALRRALSRLQSESARDLEGLMTQETFDLYHLRHAEMHLSFIVAEDGEGNAAGVVGPSTFARLIVWFINTFNRCAEGLYNLLYGPSRRTKR